MTVVTFLTRRGCHLCETARRQLDVVADQTPFTLEVRDVDADPELRAEYGDQVPVVLVDGKLHTYFQLDPERLLATLHRGS